MEGQLQHKELRDPLETIVTSEKAK